MLFSSKISKIGKGDNLSVFMPNKNEILIYSYNSGIIEKSVDLSDSKINLTKKVTTFPYHQIIKISDSLFVSRLDKSMSIFNNEQ